MKEDTKKLFDNTPVSRAVIKLALPLVISQIILVIYNMADTFFIGLTGQVTSITAVTICMPPFMFLSAIANLFGVGGSTTISRALGRKRTGRAENASAFAFYGCLLVTALYCTGVWLLRDSFLNVLGGRNEVVHTQAVKYMVVTVCFGGLFTSMSSMLANLVRAEGRSAESGAGIVLGGVLNILLDPLFMFVILPKGNEVLGAGIATALSNVISFLYYVILIHVLQKKGSCIQFHLNSTAFEDGTFREIFMTGMPAFTMTLMENISYAVLDALIASAGTDVQAGIGVAKKVNMLAHSIARGISQGVLPLIAYAYGSRDFKRMKSVIRFSSTLAVVFALAAMTINLIFARELTGIFLPEGPSLIYAEKFLRILTIGCPFSAFAYSIISFFQAVNNGRKSFILALLRKGIVDIPLMFILNLTRSADAVVWATPITDILSCAVAVILFEQSLLYLEQKFETKASYKAPANSF